MSNRQKIGLLTYDRCEKSLRGRDLLKVSYNTWISREVRDGETLYHLIHYFTKIVTYHENGAVVIDTKGYRSATTKDRIRDVTGANLYQKKHVWYVGKAEYYDGINVGVPRDQGEALEEAARNGDPAAKMAYQDWLQDHSVR